MNEYIYREINLYIYSCSKYIFKANNISTNSQIIQQKDTALLSLSFSSFPDAQKHLFIFFCTYSYLVCRNVCKGSAVQEKDMTRSQLILNVYRMPGRDLYMVKTALIFSDVYLDLQDNDVLEYV